MSYALRIDFATEFPYLTPMRETGNKPALSRQALPLMLFHLHH
jgi:hypothetical protein